MIAIAEPWWMPGLLAAVLLGDAIASIRPPKFIQDCLEGVRLPREWWWILNVIKMLAAAGLIVGFWSPGVGFAANAGVVLYFICAAAAHLRAQFLGRAFWVNCLGMLLFSALTLCSWVRL